MKESLLTLVEAFAPGMEEIIGVFDDLKFNIEDAAKATEKLTATLDKAKSKWGEPWGEGIMMVTAGPGIPAGSEERIKQAYWNEFLRMNPHLTEEELLKWRKRILGYEEGGFVRETGPAWLEKNEYVLKPVDLSKLMGVLHKVNMGLVGSPTGVPHYEYGGVAKEAGLAYVEKGERMTPPGQPLGPTITMHINFMPGTRITDVEKGEVRNFFYNDIYPLLLEAKERTI